MKKGSKFTVEIIVSQDWIDDGFDLTTEQHQFGLKEAILTHMLGYANHDEVEVKTITTETEGEPMTLGLIDVARVLVDHYEDGQFAGCTVTKTRKIAWDHMGIYLEGNQTGWIAADMTSGLWKICEDVPMDKAEWKEYLES